MLAPRVAAHHPISDDASGVAANATTVTVSNHIAFWQILNPSQPFVIDWMGPSITSPARVTRFSTGFYAEQVPQMSDVYHPGNKEVLLTTT